MIAGLSVCLSGCGAKQKNPPLNQAIGIKNPAPLDTNAIKNTGDKQVMNGSFVSEKEEKKIETKRKPPKVSHQNLPPSSEVQSVTLRGEKEESNAAEIPVKSLASKEKNVKAKTTKQGKVNFMTFDKANIPTSIKYIGKIIHGNKWQTKTGTYLLIFTETGAYESDTDGKDAEVYAYLYLNQSEEEESYNQVWKIHDYVSRCEYTVICNFIRNTISVTDLDNDNTPEISFAYKNGCKGEESNYMNKIFMIEGGKQYRFQAAEGSVIEPNAEGNFLDSSWNTAAEEIRIYIQDKWRKAF